MKEYNFLAFDIGATSGRAVLGVMSGAKFEIRELYRFTNQIMELHGKYYWNIFHIYESLKETLRICAKEKITIDSIGIDIWGVDFGYIGKDGSLLGLPRAYRDP
jgi:Sugar (pentulose and hexulose) kinases